MFINNVTGDANFTEGIGSILSYKLMSYALSQVYNLSFINNPLVNVAGNEFMDLTSKQYDKEINDYFNLDFKNSTKRNKKPFDIIFGFTNKPKLSIIDNAINHMKLDIFNNAFLRNIEKIQKNRILSDLSQTINDSTNQKYFKEGLNIVIHLRAPLREIDIKFEPDRNYFYGSYKDLDMVNNFIRQIEHSEKNQKLNFHILTIGKNNTDKISTIFPENDVYVHDNLNIFETFTMMIHNDGFLAGYSNLSYVAHLLSEKRTIFPNNCFFGVKAIYPNIIRLDQRGMIERLNSARPLQTLLTQ